MSHGGYGIAGHKNNYSTRVLNGNWVQDKIGKLSDDSIYQTIQFSHITLFSLFLCVKTYTGSELVKNRPNHHVELTTETTTNYINPKDMPNKCNVGPPGPVIMRAEEVGKTKYLYIHICIYIYMFVFLHLYF
jgi:hypothetical protein